MVVAVLLLSLPRFSSNKLPKVVIIPTVRYSLVSFAAYLFFEMSIENHEIICVYIG